MKHIDLEKLGRRCRVYRIRIGYSLKQAAAEIGCSSATLSRFETGHNDSATILCWYLRRGLKWEDLKNGSEL